MDFKQVERLKEIFYSRDQFKVEFDLDGYKKFVEQFDKEYSVEEQSIQLLANSFGIEKFNINSSKSRAQLLSAAGVDVSKGTTKEVLEQNTDKVSKALVSFSTKENLRRKIHGSKKGENSFESKVVREGDRWILVGTDWTLSDGRSYQKDFYTMPNEIRAFVKPYVGNEFIYFDLSAAELTLAAVMSKDTQLLDDIYSGNFWDYWYKRLNLDKSQKGKIKVAIYSVIYSLSDYSIEAPVPKKFYSMFIYRYPELYKWLTSRAQECRKAITWGRQTFTNTAWFGQEIIYDMSLKNPVFRALNQPIQQGLANIVQVVAEYLSFHGVYVSAVNFDSVLCSGTFVNNVKRLVSEAFETVGIRFLYKIATGSTYAEAQSRA